MLAVQNCSYRVSASRLNLFTVKLKIKSITFDWGFLSFAEPRGRKKRGQQIRVVWIKIRNHRSLLGRDVAVGTTISNPGKT